MANKRKVTLKMVAYIQQLLDDMDNVWECSGCGLLWVITDDGLPSEHKMQYCPQCGGKITEEKMREEEFQDE